MRYGQFLMFVCNVQNKVYSSDQRYTKNKQRIIETEHLILRVLNFIIEADLPQKYLLNMSRYFELITQGVFMVY